MYLLNVVLTHSTVSPIMRLLSQEEVFAILGAMTSDKSDFTHCPENSSGCCWLSPAWTQHSQPVRVWALYMNRASGLQEPHLQLLWVLHADGFGSVRFMFHLSLRMPLCLGHAEPRFSVQEISSNSLRYQVLQRLSLIICTKIKKKKVRFHQKLPSSQPFNHNLMIIIDYFTAFHSCSATVASPDIQIGLWSSWNKTPSW